jgi:hypothetical protein
VLAAAFTPLLRPADTERIGNLARPFQTVVRHTCAVYALRGFLGKGYFSTG